MSLERLIINLVTRVAELERRQASTVQQGPVHEVDPKAGTVRLRLGGTDDEPFLSAQIPYAQMAGGMKAHIPPTKGQQMSAVFGGGDFQQGLAIPMTWSDQNKSPSEKGDENVITYGGFTITLTGDALHIKGPKVFLECGGSTFELTGGGLKMVAADYQFD